MADRVAHLPLHGIGTGARAGRPPIDHVLSSLHEVLPPRDLRLLSVEVFPLSESSAPVTRFDTRLRLAGTHAAIKSLVADWTEHFDSAAVVTLDLRRTADTADAVEASLHVAWWFMPEDHSVHPRPPGAESPKSQPTP